MSESRLRRVLVAVFPAVMLPLQLLLFGTHTIYAGNQQEFNAPYWSLVPELIPVIAASATVLLVIALVLPARLYQYYLVALVSLGVVCWIQGNLIVGNYGVLNGEEIDWSSHAWRSRYELALWIGVPVAAVALAPKVFSTAVFASRVLVVLQAGLLAFSAIQANAEASVKWQGAPEAIFELSSTQNVFHFVLDGFQSDVFHDIVENERAEMDRTFAGFTFFANHAGAFPTTIVSIPAMLTGEAYRNQEPMRRYIAKQFRHASLFSAMRAQGYQVDVVSGLSYDKGAATNYYGLPTPYVTYESYRRFAAWQLADLALFRHSPHAAKPWIYNGQSWRLQDVLGKSGETANRRHLPVNGEAFLGDFTRRMRVPTDRPVYKYVHVGVPHWPMALDAECRYIGVKPLTRETYAGQARCAVRRVGTLLDRLRELGVYDNSLIVISSDHGIALPPAGFSNDRDVFGANLSVLAGSALALLVVKPPHSSGPMQISGAPTAITDIPATILDTLDLKNPFGGASALKIDQRASRPRTFATYPWRSADWHADHFPYMDLFSIDGRVLDGNNWKPGEPIYAPGLDPGGRSRGFYRPERGGAGMVFRWSTPLAFLHAPEGAHGVEMKVRSVATTAQTLTIEMRGQTIDRVELADHDWHTLRYPISRAKGTTSTEWITMRVDPPWRVRGDARIFGVMTRDLKWN